MISKRGECFSKWPCFHLISPSTVHLAVFVFKNKDNVLHIYINIKLVNHNCLPLFFTLSSDSHGVLCVVLTGWSLIAHSHSCKKKEKKRKKKEANFWVCRADFAVHPQHIQCRRTQCDSVRTARAMHWKRINCLTLNRCTYASDGEKLQRKTPKDTEWPSLAGSFSCFNHCDHALRLLRAHPALYLLTDSELLQCPHPS